MPHPGERDLFKLLGSLYDAAADPALWEPFLQQLADHTGAHSSAIVMHEASASSGSYTVSSAWQVNPEATRLYQEYYGALDVWAAPARFLPSGQVATSESLCAPSEFRATEIYNDLLCRFDIEHGLFGLVENSPSRLAVVSLYRGGSEPEFDSSQIKVLKLLSPHIQRAFKLHFQFFELKAKAAGFSVALDMLATGVVLLGANGKILLMNRAANAIVAQNDGLQASAQGLSAQSLKESAELDKLIRDAVSTAEGKGLAAGGGLSITRNKRTALQVLVSPVQDRKVDASQTLRAIVFITDPEKKARPTQDILRIMFGLTPAECRVALLLGDGKPPREIAKLLAVSPNTVKSQASIIYSKTRTSRHAELVRLLLCIPGSSSLGTT